MNGLVKGSIFMVTLYATCYKVSGEQPIMDVPETIRYWGYPAEEHQVTTDDGYILTMHRIPSSDPGNGRPPVYLGHCLLCTSGIWTFGPPETELAYMLSDLGYDVWMGNIRGNTWSKNHVSLSTEDPAFWDFEWGTTGTHDYPALIDYVLQTTGADDIFYVGFSMGTTQYFVFLSELPEYNDKIRAGFMLAPAVFMGNGFNPVFELAEEAEELINHLHHDLDIYEFLPHNDFISRIGHELCDDEHPISENLCVRVLSKIMPNELINASMISFYLDHLPGGASLEMFEHYAQNYLNPGEFLKFDFGPDGNMEAYGQSTPPAYDLSRVTVPTSLFAGNGDGLAAVADVDILAAALPNLHYYEVISHPTAPYFTHLAFPFATTKDQLFNNKIIQLMEDFL